MKLLPHQLGEEYFRRVYEESPVGYQSFNTEGHILNVNPAWLTLLGYNREEVIGRPVENFLTPASQAAFAEQFPRFRERGSISGSEFEMRRKDGSVLTVAIDGVFVRDAEGRLQHTHCVLHNVTERKRAEQRLQTFQFATDQADDAVFWMDRHAGFYYVNDQACHSLGYTREELMRLRLFDIDPTYPEERWKADWAQFHEKRIEVQRLESFHRRKDGVVFPIEVVGKHCWFGDTELHVAYVRDITGRKQVEKTLRESEARYRTLFDESADGILIADVETKTFKYANPAMRRMLGYTEDELRTMGVPDIHPKDALQSIVAEFETQARGDKTLVTDIPCLRKDGSVVHADINGVTITFDGRACNVGFFRDITERKQAAQRVTDALNFNQTMFRASPVGIAVFKATGPCVSANEAIGQIIGGPREEVLKQNFRQLESWKSSGMLAAAEAALATQTERKLETQCVTTFGRNAWFFCRFAPFHYEGELHLLIIISDITERKRTEEALRESRALYYSFVEQLPIGIFRKDREGRFILVNPEFCRFKGMKAEEFLGKTPMEVAAVEAAKQGAMGLATKYAASGAEHHEQIMQTGKPIDLVEEYIYADGRKQFLHVIKLPVVDPDGKIIGTQGIQFDITELKQAEERIREQAALLDAANDAIYVRSLNDAVTYWNDGSERLYGWTRAEALDRKIHDLIKYDKEAFATAQAALLAQGNWSGELKMTNKTDKAVTVFCRWTLLRDESGRPKEVLAINTDITERKQLEANFLRAQRMEGIGALAGGIAHDLNNILQPILMTAPFLRETTNDPESREMLNTVENCAQRGADIIKQLLTFARGQPSARVPLPVRHLLNEMSKLIHETFPKNIQLHINVPKDLWQVLGDATQIHQALMNLCVNARDAMPNGGTLTLTAGNLILDEAFATMMPSAKPGPHVCVSVADTGMGIPPEHLDRIFDPFFTTKEIGKGTGLGLATVLGIARGHGGFVRVNSQAGKGTIFELYLPAASEAKAAARSKPETLPPRAGGELILVVDDEADVRGVVRRTLEKHGYRVLAAAEGSEAMGLFAQHRAEVRAVLTDMMMPDMDGPSLVRTLRHLEPQLPILGMTGVGEKADIKGLETLDLLVLLTKPFNIAGLLGVLHQALATPRKGNGKP